MLIKDTISNKKLSISVEIFPPKKDSSLNGILKTVEELKELELDFISVTCGAGGSSRGRTIELASEIKNKYGIEVVAHLTCITSTKEEIKSTLHELKSNNIHNVLALRGDVPKDFKIQDNLNYKYSKDLICELYERKDFCIAAAAYPEGHIECRNLEESIRNLKEKVDCGVDILITQLFFDNNNFYEFQEKLYKYNINVPVIAGIMPAIDKKLIERISMLSGAFIPEKLRKIMNRYENSPEALAEAGRIYAIEQISDLIINDVNGIHLYSMNRPCVVKAILENIKEIRKKTNHKEAS